MFYNASAQGTAKMARLVARSKRARMIYGSLVPLGFMLTLLNLGMSGDDEAEPGRKFHSDIPDWEQRNNIIIRTGKGRGDYIKIPLAFGLKIPFYLGVQAAMTLMGQVSPGKAAGNVLSNTVDAFNPLGSGSTLNILAPTLLDPVVDLFTNRDFRDRPVVPDREPWNEGLPRSSQAQRSTSPTFVGLAESLNRWTGGNRYAPGMLDLYPGWIEYGAGWVTGGLGRFISNTVDMGVNAGTGVETPIEKIPVVRRFVGSDAGQEAARYYDSRRETMERANRLRAARKAMDAGGATDEARAAYEREMVGLNVKTGKRNLDWSSSAPGTFEAADKIIAEQRRQIDAVRHDRSMSARSRSEKEKAIDALMRDAMNRARKDANSILQR